MLQNTLKKYGLSATRTRLKVLELFFDKGCLLSASEIEKLLSEDRITIYRTLKSFEEKGLIFTTLQKNKVVYGLCPSKNEDSLKSQHAHFFCISCKTSECLNILIPTLKNDIKHKITSAYLTYQGFCQACQA